jgi:hypothetical protein
MISKEKSVKVSTILQIISKLRKKYSNFEKVYKPSLISEDNYQYITSSNDVFMTIDGTKKIKLFKPKCFSDGAYFSLEAEYVNLAYVECTFEKIVAIIDRNFKIYNDYRKEFLKTKVEEL